jgi:hypothetical protein
VAAPLLAATAGPPAPLWLVFVTGLVAAGIAAGAWVATRAAVTIVHESGHALAASAVGVQVKHIEIHANGNGGTAFANLDTPGRDFLTTVAGYLGPPLFGIAGAILLSTGRVRAVLWLSLLLAAGGLWLAKGRFSVGAMVGLGGVLFLVIRYAGAAAQTFFTYTWIWFLLIGGIRTVLILSDLRATAKDTSSDAFELSRITSLPAAIFVGFFTVVGFAALVAGGLIMAGAVR